MAIDDARISLHHVGGRSGSRSFPTLQSFEADMINVLYEADPESIAQIRILNEKLNSELHVFPYALSNRSEKGKLHITYDPFSSSLYERKDSEFDFFMFSGNQGDCIVRENLKTMETMAVDLHALDDLADKAHGDVPAPDFLSIDTQGSEFDIIVGAERTIRQHVAALVVEVEFVEIYRGQKLYGDIVKKLDELGFVFVCFTQTNTTEPYRFPMGLRGNGFCTSGDALFFRKPSCIAPESLMWEKLAFIAFVFDQPAFGFQCLSQVDSSADAGDSNRNYRRFLVEIRKAVQMMQRFFPQTFSELFTFEESKTRFLVGDEYRERLDSLHAALAKRRHLFAQMLVADRPLLNDLLDERDTPVELVFRNFGMDGQADSIRNVRRTQVLGLLEAYGVQVRKG